MQPLAHIHIAYIGGGYIYHWPLVIDVLSRFLEETVLFAGIWVCFVSRERAANKLLWVWAWWGPWPKENKARTQLWSHCTSSHLSVFDLVWFCFWFWFGLVWSNSALPELRAALMLIALARPADQTLTPSSSSICQSKPPLECHEISAI